MIRFILRRSLQATLTILGVMVLTFLLFRVIAADIAAVYVGDKGSEEEKAAWRQRKGYDRPLLLNVHRRLQIKDLTTGDGALRLQDVGESRLADALAMIPSDLPNQSRLVRLGRYVWDLDRQTPIRELVGASAADSVPGAGGDVSKPVIKVDTSADISFTVDLHEPRTCGDILNLINQHPQNINPITGGPLVEASIADWSASTIADSQFFHHFKTAATFQSRSLIDNKKLTEIVAERAPKSLALTIPAMAIGWLAAMVVSCFVAYYRGTLVDKIGVFLSVLGMCVPFLGFMIYGQWLMFKIAPERAFGLGHRTNVYIPILIMVIAGLGASVRFYRTVIMDEINRDYVRTARAKGVPLPGILFKHVLKNCMLPILTNLILSIPFLIMGSLLVESYFGIPGLGDLMLTSINGRDEPIMTGLVFLSTLIYTVGVAITDISYAVFDPRIRLQ